MSETSSSRIPWGEVPAGDRIAARRMLRDRRRARDPQTLLAIDQAIFAAVRELLAVWPIGASCVAFYWPLSGEPDPRDLMRQWHLEGHRLALPRVIARGAALGFCEWTPEATMIEGLLGTREPAVCAECLPQVLVVPCLGFDARGYRLGYGGGFYDRTLAQWQRQGHRVHTIGVATDDARLGGFEPRPHDLPLDWIVTESGPVAGRSAPR